MSSWKMEREGTFLLVMSGDHCGNQQYQRMSYSVKIKCGAILDNRGFLFDQLSIDKYFQSLSAAHNGTKSCELLAVSAAHSLVSLALIENPECNPKKIKVRIGAEPYAAAVTYTIRVTKAYIATLPHKM